jgi:hypothetical protein
MRECMSHTHTRDQISCDVRTRAALRANDRIAFSGVLELLCSATDAQAHIILRYFRDKARCGSARSRVWL